jgi:Effector Associated Constant Component 1
VRVRIAVDGADTDVEALWDWLRHEPQLRGRLRTSSAAAPPDAMGGGTELVVEVASALAGAGAIWAALAKSLATWLKQRRSDVSIEITLPNGLRVMVSADRVGDAEQVINAAFRDAREALSASAQDE